MKKTSRNSSAIRNESGQSIILVSVVILSFLLFFGFVINTGLLVTAKISVQAAADAAAYAGAATQARQLNAISFLNYDMRRQFKKFAYRYNFFGAASGHNFPNRNEKNFNTDRGPHYGYPKLDFHESSSGIPRYIRVPVICIPITGSSLTNDECTQLNLPNNAKNAQQMFQGGGITQITQSLLTAFQNIQDTQKQKCMGQGGVNLFTLLQWLFRANFDDNQLITILTPLTAGLNSASGGPSASSVIDRVKGLVNGLGLYPRNIITLMRIETLRDFLNHPAEKEITTDSIESWEKGQNAESYERTIQAFKSATANLNGNVMASKDVIMTELQNDNQLNIELVQGSMNALVQYIEPDTDNSDSVICNSQIKAFPVSAVPLGVKRTNPDTPIHYAVKVKAKAKLMFLPVSGGLELEAFASAKPFGSRIGPTNLSEADFVENIKLIPGDRPHTPLTCIDNNSQADTCKVPNPKITDQDSFLSPNFLQAMAALTISNNAIDFSHIENAIAPQPVEVGHYNILPPAKNAAELSSEFIPYALDQTQYQPNGLPGVYRFYAPVFPAGGGDPKKRVDDIMDEVFGRANVGGNNNQFNLDMTVIKTELTTQMLDYISNLTSLSQPTENGETLTFAALKHPIPVSPALSPNQPLKLWLTTANEVCSSWGPDRGTPVKPRFGYSVKFVAMQNLLSHGMNSSDDEASKISH